MDTRSRVGITPPRAPRRPLTSIQHGMARVDDYAWLRAANWQAVMRDPGALAPDIRAQLEAENAYTLGLMADTEELQQQLFAEMKGRIKEDDSSVPAPDGSFSYYTRFVTGGQHPLFCRLPRGGGDEQILIDGRTESVGRVFADNVGEPPCLARSEIAEWEVDQRGDEARIGDERLPVEGLGLASRGFVAGIERRRLEKQLLAPRDLVLRDGGLAGGHGGARAPRRERDDARRR